MKKEEYFSIFMTTLMIVIPIGAVIALLIEIFGCISIPENKNAYNFIKDHGSLIAGLIALFAAWWTIQTQHILRNKNRFDDKKEYLAREMLRTKSIIINMDSLFNKLIQGNSNEFESNFTELSNQFEQSLYEIKLNITSNFAEEIDELNDYVLLLDILDKAQKISFYNYMDFNGFIDFTLSRRFNRNYSTLCSVEHLK